MKLIAAFDGGMQSTNPGPAGYGYVISTPKGKILKVGFAHIGFVTNNHAEYSGLIAVLKFCREAGATHVVLRTDSQLVARQMQGLYRVKDPGIKILYEEATKLAGRFESVGWDWTPREGNLRADRLAKRGAWDVPGVKYRVLVSPVQTLCPR